MVRKKLSSQPKCYYVVKYFRGNYIFCSLQAVTAAAVAAPVPHLASPMMPRPAVVMSPEAASLLLLPLSRVSVVRSASCFMSLAAVLPLPPARGPCPWAPLVGSHWALPLLLLLPHQGMMAVSTWDTGRWCLRSFLSWWQEAVAVDMKE
ncbi:UNVERIFIED_CONTAM: hypothetical protein K2H54_047448 [Gekko kuhli]